jgi:Holliday junction DNA helicase RuvA
MVQPKMVKPENLSDLRQLFVVKLDNGGQLHRVGKNFRAVEILAEVDIENAYRFDASRLQEIANGGTAARRALSQRSEAHGIGLLGQNLPLRRPLEKVPRDGLCDLKARLTAIVNLDFHRSRGMVCIVLNEAGRKSQLSEAENRFLAEQVLADTAGGDSVIAEQRRDVGEVGGRPAELSARGKQIPEQLPQADDRVLFSRHVANSLTDAAAKAPGPPSRILGLPSPLQWPDMIAHLRGKLLAKHPNQAVVETGGVGYDVTISVPTYSDLPAVGAEVALHIHTHVREDLIALYGFLRPSEKLLFEKLITVSGIGPKLAITVLSGMAAQDVVGAIRGNDVARLTRIPGIGKKTAERMVLELRDKMPEPGTPSAPAVSGMSAVEEDVLSALVNLGYQRAAAEKSLAAVVKGGKSGSFDTMFREAMAALSK